MVYRNQNDRSRGVPINESLLYIYASAQGASKIFLQKKYQITDFGKKNIKKVREQKKV